MNDHMKQLCDVAESLISEFGQDLAPGSLAREVVRAVLIELRKVSPGMERDGGDQAVAHAAGDEECSITLRGYPAGIAFTAMIDRVLAE